MAHKRELPDRKCYWNDCPRPAKWEVRTTRNAVIGEFCREHADQKVHQLNTDEQRHAEMLRERE